MGTRYEEVYERYRGQVRNYEFLDYDAVTREAMQLDLLKMAISDFEDVCKQDLNDREDDLVDEPREGYFGAGHDCAFCAPVCL